jgi:adenosylhomocysteine nucleosidase
LDDRGGALFQTQTSGKRVLSGRSTIPLYTAVQPPYALDPMLLIAAAMEEELKIGMDLCERTKKVSCRSVSLRQACRNDREILFLKTGVGPRRSAASLEKALKVVQPSLVMMVGYAGALDPQLRLGDLVAVKSALAFSLEKSNPTWDHILLEGKFELAGCEALAETGKTAGLNSYTGDTLTSSYVLGDPVHKRLLYEKFQASIVDMETASLARVAASRQVPFSCVRVISDEAEDTFLAPVSYDPATGIPARAKKLMSTGMVRVYREWKKHTSIAGDSLSRYLFRYL